MKRLVIVIIIAIASVIFFMLAGQLWLDSEEGYAYHHRGSAGPQIRITAAAEHDGLI